MLSWSVSVRNLRWSGVNLGYLAKTAHSAVSSALAWISDRLWPGKRIRSLKWTIFACALSVVALMLLPAQSPGWLLVTLMPPIFGLVVDSSNYQAAWTLLVAILVLGAMQLRRSTTRTAG